MARRIRLALWWHMHQPSYRNGFERVSVMPLVFIHAAKDYYDMLRLATSRESIRTTFNLVPSLLDQIEGFQEPESDVFLQVLRKKVKDLDEDDLNYLFDFLFIGSVRHQILPLRRYYELYDRWERRLNSQSAGSFFTPQEVLDIQVLFLIAWTGPMIREEEPLLRRLMEKGGKFEESEKMELVELLVRRVAGIIPAYREALESGAIEITTSPYYHPILPLLHDFKNARAVERGLPLPVICEGLQEDAPLQVQRAVDRFQEVFGVRCSGMWPSEGAVSAAALEDMMRSGISYAASDEEVLANSLAVSLPGMAGRRKDLYSPWSYQGSEASIGMFFRDRGLSDLIGFTYQRMESAHAVKHFIGKVHEIRGTLDREDAVLAVILDGENAWEHYPGNGRPFLEGLYDALAADPAIETVTFSQALEGAEPHRLANLTPGSWIGGRLSTWVGHPEKNRAWELICRTRERVQKAAGGLSEAARESAMEQILTAEGSDWCWWYGEDHFTTLADRFDELFRLHLINACRFAGLEVPAELQEPIRVKKARGHMREPLDILSPSIDGQETSYFEWLNAGIYDLDFDQGAMHLTDPVLRKLRYGFDHRFLYLRLDTSGDFSERTAGHSLGVEFVEPRKTEFKFTHQDGALQVQCEGEACGDVQGAVGRIAEIAIPLDRLDASPGREILFSFSLWKGADPVEKAPLFTLVKVRVPEDYELEYWIV